MSSSYLDWSRYLQQSQNNISQYLQNYSLKNDSMSFVRDLHRRRGSRLSSDVARNIPPVNPIQYQDVIEVEIRLQSLLSAGKDLLKSRISRVNSKDCVVSLMTLNAVLNDHFTTRDHPLRGWGELTLKINDIRGDVENHCNNIPALTEFTQKVYDLCDAINVHQRTLQAEANEAEERRIITARTDSERTQRERVRRIIQETAHLAGVVVLFFFTCTILYLAMVYAFNESARFTPIYERVGSRLTAASNSIFAEQSRVANEAGSSANPLHLSNSPSYFPVVTDEVIDGVPSRQLSAYYSPYDEDYFLALDARKYNRKETRAQMKFALVTLRDVARSRFDYFRIETGGGKKCVIPKTLKDIMSADESKEFVRIALMYPSLADISKEIIDFNQKRERPLDDRTLNALTTKVSRIQNVKLDERNNKTPMNARNFETELRIAVNNHQGRASDTDDIVKLARSWIANDRESMKQEDVDTDSVVVFHESDDSNCKNNREYDQRIASLWAMAYSLWDAILLEHIWRQGSLYDTAKTVLMLNRNPLGRVKTFLLLGGAGGTGMYNFMKEWSKMSKSIKKKTK